MLHRFFGIYNFKSGKLQKEIYRQLLGNIIKQYVKKDTFMLMFLIPGEDRLTRHFTMRSFSMKMMSPPVH
jgi:hypothetical protein